MSVPVAGLLVCVGVASLDTIAVVDDYPDSDERVVADALVIAGGGPAATAAVAAARLGVPTAVVATVGDDAAGQAVIDGLAAEGVDTTGISIVAGAATCQSVVVISRRRNHRAIVNRPGPDVDLTDGAQRLLESAAWVHADQHGWPAVAHVVGGLGGRVSIDAGNDVPDLRLDDVDLYVPTLAALKRRYPLAADEPDRMRQARRDGARAVIVSDGAAGSRAIWADGSTEAAPAPTDGITIASTLGAGDVFHGALLAGVIRSESDPTSMAGVSPLAYATTVASLSCAGVDGRSAIPRHSADLIRRIAHSTTQETAGLVR